MTGASVRDGLDGELSSVLAAAGVTGPHAPLVPLAGGQDNDVYATRAAGRELVVKAPRSGRVRYGVAAWAAAQLVAVGVPAPRVVGYRDRLLVETRCPGMPLHEYRPCHDGFGGSATPLAVEVATAAGHLLRRVHTVPVHGYGRLDTTGVGLRPSLGSWILHLPPLPSDTGADLYALRGQAQQVLRHHLHLLQSVPAALLHGDWTARHVIVDDGRITGIVDLESVRGGDPLADLAGWSLQEPRDLTGALFGGYFTGTPSGADRMRLALYRIRIAAAMLAPHVAHGEHAQLALRTAQLHADLADLSCGQPATLPAITPCSTEHGGPTC